MACFHRRRQVDDALFICKRCNTSVAGAEKPPSFMYKNTTPSVPTGTLGVQAFPLSLTYKAYVRFDFGSI